ncbi:MAG TPA: hypothetical protein VML75_16215, partial [Kofleriaceae bacterium]|nr:hypothetical protein [Kofleriaceae bacterium]
MHTGPVLLRMVIASAVVCAASLAQAQPREVIVSWSAPPECAPAAAVYPLIEEHLGRGLNPGDALAARVEIGGVERGYRARLRFGDGTPERVLEGASCESVVDAAALIMALALREATPVAPPPAPAVATVPSLGVANGVTPEGPRRWGLAVRIDGVGGVGVMPGAGLAAGVSVGVLVGEWRVGIEGGLWRDDDASLEMVSDAGATIDLWTAGVVGCRSLGAPLLAGCAGLEAGSMGAVGYGFEGAGRGSELWL